MKLVEKVTIQQMAEGVPVTPHPTVASALAACSCRSIVGSLVRAIISRCHFKQSPDACKLSEIIKQPIWYPFGERKIFYRQLALASLSRPMTVHEFHQALQEKGFRPASINGGAAFIPILRACGRLPDSILHLGTPMPDESFREWYLVTKKNGTVQVVPLLLEMKLQTQHRIVVEKVGK